MKRNVATILKYLIFAALLLTLGPLLMKMMIGDGPPIRQRNRDTHHFGLAKGAGPVDPEDLNKIFESNDWNFKTSEPGKKTVFEEAEPRQTPKPSKKNGVKRDWHNYEQIRTEEERKGPGEQGVPYNLIGEEEEKKALFAVNGFNAHVSDKIALDRAIPDIRHPECRGKKYLRDLLTASIVVPFHNEHWSTLLRTVVSVLNRSPKELLHEIILVDDFSTKERLKEPLDKYLKEHFTNVKVVRQSKREGLIRTRIAGARAATGDVLIFLDSHVEANVNWLPPLLEPIAQSYRTVVCPFIDVINYDTFEYKAQDEGARGAFDWQFFYKRLPLLKRDLVRPSEPFNSPVMAGGLFAISTKWFWEMGGYDPGLDIWGGEQYELSFKIWQCGGKMVDAPCSRVGHIYRKFAPFPNPGLGDFIARNYKRVAEVWMDEYKEYIYQRKPYYRNVDPGDMSAQLAIREKLHCKPFKWFMTKIAFDLPKKYPLVQPLNTADGELRNVGSSKCLDMMDGSENDKVFAKPCMSDQKQNNHKQDLSLTWHHDIRSTRRTICLDIPHSVERSPVLLYSCHGLKGNQWFKYNVDTQQIFHYMSNKCVDTATTGDDIFVSECDTNKNTQKWLWKRLDEQLARERWQVKKDEDEYDGEPPDSDI